MQMVVSPAHESCYWLFSIWLVFKLSNMMSFVWIASNASPGAAHLYGLAFDTPLGRPVPEGADTGQWSEWDRTLLRICVSELKDVESLISLSNLHVSCSQKLILCIPIRSHLPLYSSACMLFPPFKPLAAGTTQGMPVSSTQLPRWFAAFEAIQKLKQPKTNVQVTIWKYQSIMKVLKQKERIL